MTSSPIPVIGTIAGGAIPSPSIPPPPTHLYPHRPPVASQFGSISMGTPPRGLPPHIQQMMIRASPGGPIPFPPPNFSTPPPPIGQRPPFTMSATSVQFPLGQNVTPGPPQTAQKGDKMEQNNPKTEDKGITKTILWKLREIDCNCEFIENIQKWWRWRWHGLKKII